MEIKITFHNNLRDIIWLNLYQMPRARSSRIASLLLLVPMGYIAFDLARSPLMSILAKVVFFIVYVGGTIVAMVVLQLLLIVLLCFFDRKSRSTVYTLTASEICLITDTATSRTELKWAGVEEIRRSQGFILIYLSHIMAHVVPSRAFACPGDADKFYDVITAHWRKSRTEAN